MKKLVKILRFVYHTIALVRRPDGNLKSLKVVSNVIGGSRAALQAISKLKSNPDFVRLVFERGPEKQIEKADFKSYGVGTFGRAMYDFYEKNGFEVYRQFPEEELRQDFQYVTEMIRRNHDYLHVILGYNTDLMGEAQVNAFVASQTRLPFSFLVAIGLVARTLVTDPSNFGQILDRVVSAWRKGANARFFLTEDWLSLLQQPLSEVKLVVLNESNSVPQSYDYEYHGWQWFPLTAA